MGRRKIFAGNWKMYKTSDEALDLVRGLAAGIRKIDGREYVVFPPSPYLKEISSCCASTPFRTGAQNMYHENQGAFTGEVSPLMVKDCGASFILIGHSERRNVFHETDEDVNKKIKAALFYGIEPLLCIGELLADRESGKTVAVLDKQIRGAFSGLDKADAAKVLIAYEPVWAIGTGKVATPEIAESTHVSIRNIMKELYGGDIASALPILYGGSVKPDNIAGLYKMDNIDGFLVGGASLEINAFLEIINIR